MKKYTTPDIEMVELEAVDVIQTSNGLENGGEGNTSGDPIYFGPKSSSLNSYIN